MKRLVFFLFLAWSCTKVPADVQKTETSREARAPIRASAVTCSDSAIVAQFANGGEGPCRFLVQVVNERPCEILFQMKAYGVSPGSSEYVNADALCRRRRPVRALTATAAPVDTYASVFEFDRVHLSRPETFCVKINGRPKETCFHYGVAEKHVRMVVSHPDPLKSYEIAAIDQWTMKETGSVAAAIAEKEIRVVAPRREVR